MNKEYLEAKFDLCINQAEKNIKEEEIAEAIKNLKRANSALSKLFGFEQEDECDVCEAKNGEPHCDCGNCDCAKEEDND